jgi:hypothetical protein
VILEERPDVPYPVILPRYLPMTSAAAVMTSAPVPG